MPESSVTDHLPRLSLKGDRTDVLLSDQNLNCDRRRVEYFQNSPYEQVHFLKKERTRTRLPQYTTIHFLYHDSRKIVLFSTS